MIDIRTLKDNKPIEARFVVLRKEKKQTREGKPYADLLLGNKTGSVPAKIWDSVDDVYGLFEKETVVGVTGRVQFWNERPQITVQAIKPVPEEEIDYEEFLPATPADVGGLKIKLANLIESIKNADLNRITSRILKDGAMAKRFETAPAAKGFHHAYLGGLLEHTVSVATLCDGIAGYYVGQVNRDLLVAGALLHDIGKTQEFSYRLAIDYSTEGRLIGHHVIGYEMVEKAAAEIGVSGEAALQLLHLILSHHGAIDLRRTSSRHPSCPRLSRRSYSTFATTPTLRSPPSSASPKRPTRVRHGVPTTGFSVASSTYTRSRTLWGKSLRLPVPARFLFNWRMSLKREIA
ncbi:MAG: HD domain-containing protein [Chloroflexi bacterium]|nr:HD domain-containing protein [Chloroflexota bacterium]